MTGLAKPQTPEPAWLAEHAGASISIGGHTVARYNSGENVEKSLSPRPFLHPITTLGGIALTEESPADHAHHLGLSFAVADVGGTTYWGGKTMVPGVGYTPLDNHGVQHRLSSTRLGNACLEEVAWHDPSGGRQLLESRALHAYALPQLEGWALSWTSLVIASADVVIGSPASNGRPGAGYGGIFWRLASADSTEVFTVAGRGDSAAHESASPWLVINQSRQGRATSLVLSQPETEARPWFVRAAEYVGAGPMLVPAFALRLRQGDALRASLTSVLLDRHVDTVGEAESIVAHATAAASSGEDPTPRKFDA